MTDAEWPEMIAPCVVEASNMAEWGDDWLAESGKLYVRADVVDARLAAARKESETETIARIASGCRAAAAAETDRVTARILLAVAVGFERGLKGRDE